MCSRLLILKRASASRPSGQWNEDDYDVVADGVRGRSAWCDPPMRPQRKTIGRERTRLGSCYIVAVRM
jgi:hypothetical protein